jgi:hypothetical protein
MEGLRKTKQQPSLGYLVSALRFIAPNPSNTKHMKLPRNSFIGVYGNAAEILPADLI